MNKILATALVLFSTFIFAGVHVANGHYENDNLGQTVTKIAHPHSNSNRVGKQSSSDAPGNGNQTQYRHHHRKDHRVDINN